MNIVKEHRNIIIHDIPNFNIEQILECGQCFHFDKIDCGEYALVAKGHLLHIKQEDKKVTFYHTDEKELYNIWWQYFDLSRDYGKIIDTLLERERNYFISPSLEKDKSKIRTSLMESDLYKATKEKNGIRILNQEFFEVLISFIISQNKQIPHIKKIVSNLSQNYGSFLGEVGGKKYYTFPTVKDLSKVSEEELRNCKMGFRAPYIVDACKKVLSREVDEEYLRLVSMGEGKTHLQQIKGVGEKVSNCVLLFGLGKRAAFPVDVWIKRIMETIYFNREASNEEIMELGKELFDEYGGYAQQYLFYYGRDHELGKK